MKRTIVQALVVLIGVEGSTLFAGTDGTWSLAGSGSALWSATANWTNGIVADGQDATAYFNEVDVGMMYVSLGSSTHTLGHLIFDDTVPDKPPFIGAMQYWDFNTGTLKLSVASGISTVEVSRLTGGVGISCALTGNFRKTGDQTLYLKTMPSGSIDIDEGRIWFALNGDNTKFTTQSISGPGEVQFSGQSDGYYTFRASEYSGTLSYTGHTVISLTTSGSTWYRGTLWLEKDDVLPHATVLDLLGGKIYTRAQTVKGLTVAGLTGNAGTFITTDKPVSEIQKWTIDTAAGTSYEFAGKFGADDTGIGKNNLSLTKKGLGTQTLSGANTFIGPLVVSNGTLLVKNTTGSATGLSNSLTMCSGTTLGGTGKILSTNTTLEAGCTLRPLGVLTVTNLTLGAGLAYRWERGLMADSMVRLLGTVSLPPVATVTVSRAAGAALPPGQGVVLSWGVTNTGATDLSGWVVHVADGPGVDGRCIYDAANKRVLFNISYAPGTNGTWNYGGSTSLPMNSWTNPALWVGGDIAAGYDATAHFDAVDAVYQYINLWGATQRVGRLEFGDINPGLTTNWWGLMNGTLMPNVASGAFTVKVDNVDVYLEAVNSGPSTGRGMLTIAGSLVKTGNGVLHARAVQAGAIDIAEGKVMFDPGHAGWFSNVTIRAGAALQVCNASIIESVSANFSGTGDLILTFSPGISIKGGQTHMGKTVVDMTSINANVMIDATDAVSTLSVLSIQKGNVLLRYNQQVSGLDGGGTVGTDVATSIKTLTLNVGENFAHTYAGVIGSTLALVKNGLGTQILTGSNTFSGSVSVNAGSLLVNNSVGSGIGTNNSIMIASEATLGGTGVLLCTNAAFAASSTIAPGGTNTVGTLTFAGNVALGERMSYNTKYEAGATSSVTVGGTLTLPSTVSVEVVALDVAPLPKKITLFSAYALAGATDLSDWTVSGTGENKYRLLIDGTSVIAERIPTGTMVRVF